jgi:hypothetical protein
MRAVVTVEEFRSFNEAQWREIEASLAERGLDLNTQVAGPFVPGSRWWSPNDPTMPQRPLRQALEEMIYFYTKPKPSTPIQRAKKLQKMLVAFENALTMLRRTERPLTAFERICYSDDGLTGNQLRQNNMLRDLLTWKVAELRGHIAKLKAKGGNSDKNAATMCTDYWRELTRLWNGVTGGSGAKPRQHLRQFLIACTPPTLFPDMTAQELEAKATHFLSNRSRSRK